ncbi:LicD family protein [Marinomonas aquimarina]|uniref:LicD family protein n=1 Tax=Marinomonas aquimarina TaxID=295068 RepID=A0A1A8T3S5_9GAMM|nr:LicD family protein [Marinomonas aquimarina]SBS25465.1 LicD family protein [Marinomonas aquimarina]
MNGVKPIAVIFGASQSGLSAKHNLSHEYCFSAFIDNDPNKAGMLLDGLPVHNASALPKLKFDQVLIASEFAEQICHQLTHEYQVPSSQLISLAARDIKPFHFGDDEDKKAQAERMLGFLSEKLQSVGITFYVDAGTLLGIYRDDALIPWDDDLDFAVDASESEPLADCLNGLLPELTSITGYPWRLVSHRAERAYGAVPQGSVRGYKLQVADESTSFPMVDFFLKYIDGDVMDYVLASRGIRMPSCFMKERKAHSFHGQIIMIPSDTESYLAQHYGADWKTPKQAWNLSMLDNAEVFS